MPITFSRNGLLLIATITLMMSTSNIYSQPKESTERFKIYLVDKLSKPTTVNSSPLATAGENKDCILLDTWTGKTWLLTILEIPFDRKPGDGRQRSMRHYEWTPIFFSDFSVKGKSLTPQTSDK